MTDFLKKSYQLLSRPIREKFLYFLLLYCISSLPAVLFELFYGTTSFRMILNGLAIAYVCTSIRCILDRWRWTARLFTAGLVLVFSISLILDIVSFSIFHVYFNLDMLCALIGTNFNEAVEFFNTYFHWYHFVLVIAVFVAVSSLLGLSHKRKGCLHPAVTFCLFLLTLLSFPVFLTSPDKTKGIYGKISLLFTIEMPPDLSAYYQHPHISTDVRQHPDNVIVILGESLCKDHCSLYGYDKETNPQLSALQDSSLLHVFPNVTSPATNTVPAVQEIMSTYNHLKKDDGRKWYECTTLMELMDLSGYRTAWFSNQSKMGLYDNIVSKYAELCDTNIFVGNKFAGMYRKTTDDLLLDVIRPFAAQSSGKNFYVVHLLGSHYTFSERYPQSYSHFKSVEYSARPEHQRQTLADYDNTVLFNDYVVASILEMFRNSNTLALYFSDHSLDVYHSSDTYVGHANGTPLSQKMCRQVPFMIYTSPLYREQYPDKVEQIRSSIDKPFNTGNLVYMIMDLIGTQLPESL